MATRFESLGEVGEQILRSKAFAHVAVVDEGGAPHVSPVWVDVTDDGRVLLNTQEGRLKARLLQVGAPVALSATDPDNPYRYVMVRGVVTERRHEGAEADIHRLARKYWGTDYTLAPGAVRVTVLVEPRHVFEKPR